MYDTFKIIPGTNLIMRFDLSFTIDIYYLG